jgi:hypothetical protein
MTTTRQCGNEALVACVASHARAEVIDAETVAEHGCSAKKCVMQSALSADSAAWEAEEGEEEEEELNRFHASAAAATVTAAAAAAIGRDRDMQWQLEIETPLMEQSTGTGSNSCSFFTIL